MVRSSRFEVGKNQVKVKVELRRFRLRLKLSSSASASAWASVVPLTAHCSLLTGPPGIAPPMGQQRIGIADLETNGKQPLYRQFASQKRYLHNFLKLLESQYFL